MGSFFFFASSGPTPLLQKSPFFTMPRPMGIRSLNRCVNDCAHMFCPSPMKLSFLFFCFRPPHRALDARIGRPKRCFHPPPMPPPYTAHTAYLANLKKPDVGSWNIVASALYFVPVATPRTSMVRPPRPSCSRGAPLFFSETSCKSRIGNPQATHACIEGAYC